MIFEMLKDKEGNKIRYNNIPKTDGGWIDVKYFKPTNYDLVEIKTEKSSFFGWSRFPAPACSPICRWQRCTTPEKK